MRAGNRIRKGVWIAGLFILLLAAACAAVYYCGSMIADAHTISRLNGSVQFGHSSPDMESFEADGDLIALSDLLNYTGSYANLSSHYYKKALNRSEGQGGMMVYNAILYALDHGFSFISVPADTCPSEILSKIVYYAVFDQPMMEENTVLGLTGGALTYQEKTLQRYYIFLPTNDTEHLDYKKQALEKAREIVGNMPASNGTELEKARYLYNWLVENVRYTEDQNYNESKPHYLYDALLRGETNCDGFSNAFTLLLNLCGVECFNVGNDVQSEEDVGHTWNVMKIGGVYFQADPTAESSLYKATGENLYLYFCLSAGALGNGEYEELIRDVAPVCSDTRHDLDAVDVFVEGLGRANKDLPEMREAIERLEEGASHIIIRCDAFADAGWENSLKAAEAWFSDCKVVVTLVRAGQQYCVVFRGDVTGRLP